MPDAHGVPARGVSNGLQRELPRFLNRASEIAPVYLVPPPLPQPGLLELASRSLGSLQPLAYAKGAFAASLAATMIAWFAIVPDDRSSPKPQTVVARPKPVASVRSEVETVLETAAAIESRLSFAAGLDAELKSMDVAAEMSAQMPPGEPAKLALIVLRNLPSEATLERGAPAGEGAWAVAAGDTNELYDALDKGFDDPVTADAELISDTGATLGSLRLRLQKAPAEKVAEKQPEAESSHEEEQPKPKKHKHRAKAQAKLAAADDAYVQSRKSKRRARTSAPDENETATDENAEASNTPEDANGGQKKGMIAKFFSWLKGDGKKQQAAETDEKPEDSARSGLGMRPR